MGIRRVTSRAPTLTLMLRGGHIFLKSTFGTDKYISMLNRVSVELQSKLGSFQRIETKLL